jgi:hypothetical protein
VLKSLNPAVARFVRHADVLLADIPGIELVADGVDPRALVLLDGFASPELLTEPSCSRIFVYQRNVERAAGTPDRVEALIHEAMEREITATFLDTPSEPPKASILN